jgi:hypothetical protein
MSLEDTIYYRIAALRAKGKLFPGDQVKLAEPIQPFDYVWGEHASKVHVGLEGTVTKDRPPKGHPVPQVGVSVSARDMGVDGRETITVFLPIVRLRLKARPDAGWEGLQATIDKAFAAEKKLKENDPARYAVICAARDAEFKQQQKKWREEKRWDYRIPSDIAKRVRDTAFSAWYPLAEKYSHMCIFPPDIKPDWLAGVVETCELLIQSLIIANPGRKPRFAKESRANLQTAINILACARSAQLYREKHGKTAKLPKWACPKGVA